MSSSSARREATQYVTIGIDHEVFAISVEQVREILDLCPLTRLPNAPDFLAGMIDVRGQGVPVIELRRKLGLPTTTPTENTRIVVLEVQLDQRQITLGMVADRVFEVTALDEQDMEGAPEVGVRWRSDYIQAIGRRKGAFVIVFDLARLLSSEEIALIALEKS